MKAYPYTPKAGDVAWVNYIPVRFVSENFQEGTYNQKGFVAIDILSSSTGKQAWVDYVPVVIDDTRTDAWLVNRVGYIPVNYSGTGDGTARNAGLSLNFLGASSLDKRITFSRASNATVTGSNGLIQYAPHNLLTFSEQFDNAYWTKTNTTVSANALTAPNGTTTADTITSSAGTTTPCYLRVTTTRVASTNYVTSIYAKRGTANWFYIRDLAIAGQSIASFDLLNGVAGTVGANITSSSITAVGNDWYRCSITSTTPSTVSFNLIDYGFADADNTRDLGAGKTGSVWGAQQEVGTTLTEYNPTTVKNLLGFSEAFDNAAWTKSNSFIQTNLVRQSENFDTSISVWRTAGTGVTVALNNEVAPNGSTTADTITTTTSGTGVRQDIAFASGVTYTISAYVKSISGATGFTADLQNGETSPTFTMTSAWQRFTWTTTTASARTWLDLQLDGAGSFAVWGVQAVQGSVAGDYQQTTSSALAVMYQAPNGTMTADKLVENTATSAHYGLQQVTTVVGTPYTLSVYLKAGEKTRCALEIVNSAGTVSFRVNANLATGTFTTASGGSPTATAASMIDVGNGWYRLSAAMSAPTTATQFILYLQSGTVTTSYAGDGTSGIYIWGAQLSDSASLDQYVNNPVAAPSSTAFYGARFDYDPVTLQPRGLLIEEQRANLILQSETFDNASWSKANVTITANSVVSPDGTADADKMTTNVGQTSVAVSQSVSKATSAIQYTVSLYAKQGEWNSLGLYVLGAGNFSNRASVIFNLATGVISTAAAVAGTFTGASATINPVGNGWYRVTLTFTTGTEASVLTQIYPANNNAFPTGDGTSGIYAWGAQLEAGAFATSYIPTVASQVTRSADVAVIQGSNFSSWYNPNQGSFNLGASFRNPTNSLAFIRRADGGGSTDILFGGTTLARSSDGTTTINSNSFTSVVSGQSAKFAVSYDGSGRSVTGQGLVPVSGSYNGAYSTITSIGIASGGAGTTYLNGWLQQLAYYPRRLQNSELQAITS